jgi:ABC-type Zn2+ transport system substrate-binding protein/surface adhesin
MYDDDDDNDDHHDDHDDDDDNNDDDDNDHYDDDDDVFFLNYNIGVNSAYKISSIKRDRKVKYDLLLSMLFQLKYESVIK